MTLADAMPAMYTYVVLKSELRHERSFQNCPFRLDICLPQSLQFTNRQSPTAVFLTSELEIMMYRSISGTVVLSLISVLSLSCTAEPTTSVDNATENGVTSSEPATNAASPSAVRTGTSTDWPRFRGPGGMGVSSSTDLPLTWSETDNLVWKKELPGGGSSSPIVFGDHIYLTTYSGYLVPGQDQRSPDQLKRHLICLDGVSGDIIWNQSVDAKLPEEKRIRDHGYAANTPAADAQGVVTFFGKSGVHAFDHDGNPVWTADAGSRTHGWGTSSSPLLYNDVVYINASVESESLFALDRKTGDEKWRARGIKEAWNTPVIVKTADGTDELVVAIHGKVLGFDPVSGDQLWSCDTDITWYMVPTAVASDGIIYFLGGRSGTAALAVRAGGRGDVTDSHRLWTSKKGSNVTSPIFHDGHLYWMHEKLGIAFCAVAETGELVYEERVNRADQIYSSALMADGRIYYTNRSGRTFVVPAKPEFELLATNELRDGTLFNASPAVTGSRILIRSEKYLYCIGE